MRKSKRVARKLLGLSAAIGPALATIVGPAIQSARATSLYWDTASGAWQTAANWTTDATGSTVVGSAVPGASDTVTFNGTNVNGAETISLTAPTAAGGITFSNTGTTLIQDSVAGTETLTLGGGGIVINSGAGAVTIGNVNNAVTVTAGAAQTWTNNTGNALTFVNQVDLNGNSLSVAGPTTLTGGVTGGTTFTLGSGTFTLSAPGSFSGGTTVNGGTLNIGGTGYISNGASGAVNTTVLTLANGGLTYNPTSADTQAFASTTLNSGYSVITVGAGSTVNFGTITRTAGGVIDFSSTGSSIVANSNDVNTGILGSWAFFGTGANTRFAVGNGASAVTGLTPTAGAATTVTSTTGFVNYNINAGGTMGAAASINTLLYTGAAGTLTTTTSFKANGIVNSGSAGLIFAGAVTAGANGLVINAANSTITFNNAFAALTGTQELDFVGGSNISTAVLTAVPITGTATTPVFKNGTNTLTLATTGAVGFVSGPVPITINSGTLTLTRATNNAVTNSLGTGTITLNAAGAASLTASLAASGDSFNNPLNIIGANGTATIAANSGAHTYSGPIAFQSGTTASTKLRFTNTNSSASTLTVSGGITGTGSLELNETAAGSAITLSGANPVNMAGSITTLGAGASLITISSVIGTNVTGITQGSSNLLALTGTANTFNAPITITAGGIQFASIGNVGGGSSSLGAPTTVANGTIKMSSGTSLQYTGSASVSTDRLINIAGSATIYSTTTGTLTLTNSNPFTGTGNLTARGSGNVTVTGLIPSTISTVGRTDPGTLTLSNTGNSFTGNLSASTGTISVASIGLSGVASAAGAGSGLSLGQINTAPSATLVVTGSLANTTNRSLTIVGSTSGTAATQTIQNDSSGLLTLNGTFAYTVGTGSMNFQLQGSGNGAFDSTISSATTGTPALSLTKAGAGTWTLSQNNSYQGATAINAGTLVINGSPTGTTGYAISGTATNNATLAGTGTLAAPVTMGVGTAFTGAAINPGTVGGVGTLTINGLLTTGNFSRLNFDLNTAQTVGGVSNDLLVTNALPTITSSTQVNLNALSTLTSGSYTILNGYSGTINTAGLTVGTLTGDPTHTFLGFNSTAGALQVVIGDATVVPTMYWAGGVNGAWNGFNGTATNWRTDASSDVDPLAFPTSATDVHFYTTNPVAGNLTTTLGVNTTIKSLTFDGGALSSAVSIGGANTLTITPASSTTGLTVNSGAGAVTISAPIVLGAAQTWTNNSASLLTVGAVSNSTFGVTIDGSGNISQTGVWGNGGGGITTASTFAGVLTLSQANTFTGAVTINGGTVAANGNAAALGAGTLALAGGTLDFNHSALLAFNRNTTVSADSTVITEKNTAGAGVTYTLGTLAIGASNLTVNGGNVTSGTAGLTFGAVTQTGDSTFTVNNPVGGGVTLLTLGAITGTATNLTFAGTGNATVGGIVGTTTGSVTQQGTGVLTLSGVNTYTGTTTITSGTVSVGALTGLGTATTNIVLGGTTTKGTLLYTGAVATLGRNFTINAGGGEIDNNGSAALTLTPTTVAPISLANGPLTLGGSNTINIVESTATQVPFTGTNALTKVGNGTVNVTTTTGTALTTAAMPINVQAGVFEMTETAGVTTNILGTGLITITPGATLFENYGTFSNTANNTINIVGTTGNATIHLSGGLTHSGAVVFLAGTGTPTLILNNTNSTANTQAYTGGFTGVGNIVLNSTNTGAPITLSGTAVNNAGTITSNGTSTSTATISAAIGSNVTDITQSGTTAPFTITGGITLGGNRTYSSTSANTTGAFTLANITGTAAAASTQTVTFASGGTVNITDSGAITNGTGGGNVAVIANSTGKSYVVFSGTNTYTGGTQIQGGILDFQKTASMPGYATTAQAISVSSGGTLGLGYGSAGQFSAADVTKVLAGTAPFTNLTYAATGTALGLDTSTASADASSVVVTDLPNTTSSGLTKLGANTLTLGSTNTYSGPTWVQNGTLTVASINSVAGGTSSSSLGAPTTVGNGTISLGFATATGGLSYTGTTGETTDRVISLVGTTGGGTIDQSGSGLLKFTSNVSLAAGAKTLTLSGSATGTGEISGTIPGTISTGATPLNITKNGTGTWTLSGSNNVATQLVVSGGTLNLGSAGLTLGNTSSTTLTTTGATVGSTIAINGKVIFSGVGLAGDGADVGPYVQNVTLDLSGAVLAGTVANANVDFYNNNQTGTTLILGNANTYQGQTRIVGPTVVVTSIGTANGAAPSSLGQPAAGNSVTGNPYSTILMTSGILKYVGTGETTDRALDLRGTTTAATLDQSGTGALVFTGTNTATGAGVKVWTLQGSTAGTGEISGPIVDNTTANTTGIAKAGTGTWTLSGVNTYTGPTTVGGGNLILKSTGSLSNTSITINSGGTLSPQANFVAGSNAAGTAGAKLTLNSGGVLNLADGTIGSLTINQQASFVAANVGSFAGGAIKFDIGTSLGSVDQILFPSTVGTVTSSGANAISINPIGGSIAPGTYTLISSGAAGSTLSDAGSSNFYLASPNLNVGGTLYTLSLSGTSTTEVLTIAVNTSTSATPSAAFWNGTTNGNWTYQPGGDGTATNWVAGPTGSPDTFALPGSTTNVTFTSNSAANLSTTLEVPFTINSLTFSGTGTANTAGSTIAAGAGGSLTINAAALSGNALGNGITVQAGSGANTISANVTLGSSQTWTNNSSSPLTVSGVISDTGSNLNLTTAGSGTTVLSNPANTYGGITSINGGTLSVSTLANGGQPSSIGQSSSAASNLVFVGTGSLQYTGGSVTIDRNLTVNAGVVGTIDVTQAGTTLALPGVTGAVTTGGLTKAGQGALTLSGANTYTGNTVVSAGTLNVTGSLTGLAASTALRYGDTAGNTVVNISGTVSGYQIFTGANIAGSVAVMNQTAGSVTIVPPNSADSQYLANNGGYGMLNISGGTFNTGRFDGVGAAGTSTSAAVIYVGGTGATLNQNVGDWFLPIRTNGMMEMSVAPGASFIRSSAVTAQFSIIGLASSAGNTSYGILNVAGGTVDTGTKGIGIGQSSFSPAGTNTAFVNAAGGTLLLGLNTATGAAAGSTKAYFNFAGATVKATAPMSAVIPASTANYTFTSTIFGPITNNNNASSAFNAQIGSTSNFTGGLTVDTNNNAVTFTNALLGADSKFGVTQADLAIPSTGNSGYIGAPMVQFAAPAAGGVPASGYALISGGQVTGIVITNPGTYASGETPAITFTGGGGSIASFNTTALTTNNGVGGLTKSGAGTLTLTAANTFGGIVDIKSGLLTTNTLANGGSPSGIGQSPAAASSVLLDGGVLGYNGTVAVSTDRDFTFAASGGGFDASGTTAGVWNITPANAIVISQNLGPATFILQGTGTGTAGAGSISNQLTDASGTTLGVLKQGTGTWTVSNTANSYTGPTVLAGGTLIVGKLDVGGNSSSIGASSNAAANLVLSGGSTLQYVGTGSTTDRNYTFGNATTASGTTIDNQGTGPLVINGSMTAVNTTAANTQTFTLSAAAGTGNNSISGIVDSNTGTGALTALTKTGAGTWIVTGTSSYGGATTLSAGTLQFAGSNALNGATAIGIAAATTLQVRDDAATINHTANNITVSSAGTVTIDAGNNGGSTTGSTVSFGALNNGTTANAFNTTFNFTSANGYVQNYSSLGLTGLTGGATTLAPVGTSVIVAGAVTNQESGTVTAHFDTLALDGTSAGNQINGVISNNANYVSVGNGDTRVTKSNTSTWTLSGANTYTGPTAVNGGTLALGSGGSLGNTVITVAAGATFAPRPGSGTVAAGSTGAGTLGATLTVPATGNLNMVDGAVGRFNLNQQSSFATTGLTLTNASLFLEVDSGGADQIISLDLSSTGADQIVVSGGTTNSITGTNIINITGLGTSLTSGTYNILSAPGIAAGNTLFKFANGTTTQALTVGSNSYNLTLSSVSGIEQLVVGSGSANLTWTGLSNGNGASNSVWTATPAGNNNFADSTPTATDYTEGSAVTFQDLNTITSGNVTNPTVTVAASGVNPSAVTVNNSAVNYTFQNASGTVGIAGAASLTKTGSGKLTLLGANTYTGSTSINGGIVNLGVAEGTGNGPLGNGGTISFGGGTLQYSAANTTDYSSRFASVSNQAFNIDTNGQNVTFAGALNGSGSTLTKSGAGVLTLQNTTSTFTGNISITGGLLAFAGQSGAASDPLQLGPAGAKTVTLSNGGGVRIFTTTSNPTAGGKAFVVGTTGGDTGVFDVQGVTFQLDDPGQFSGPGNLTVQGNNTTTAIVYLNNQTFAFSGNVNISGGAAAATLRLGTGSVLGTTTGRSITVASGGELDVNITTLSLPASTTINLNGNGVGNQGALTAMSATGTISSNASIVLQSDSSVGAGSTFTLNENAVIDGNFNLTKLSAGTVILGATNTYTGTTTVSAGTLQIGTGTAGSINTANITVSSGATVSFGRSDVVSIPNSIAGAGSVLKIGAGNTTLTALSSTAASNYSGTTTIDQGTLTLNSASTVNLTGGLTFGLTSSANFGNLDLTGANASFSALTIQNNNASANTIALGSKTLTVNGSVSIGNATATNGQKTHLTVTGSTGSLIVNLGTAGTFKTGNFTGGTNITGASTVDLSGLANFTITGGATSAVTIAAAGDNSSVGVVSMRLANTANSIQAQTLSVGASAANPTQSLRLGNGTGTTNVINVDTLNLGTGGRDNALFSFDVGSGLANGSVSISNRLNTGATALFIGTNANGTGAGIANTFDVTGHTATLNFAAAAVGNVGGRLGGGTNTFSFDRGSLTFLTLSASTRTTAGTMDSIFNFGSSSSTLADTVTITNGITQLGAASTLTGAIANGTVNIAGGTVTIGNTSGTSISMASSTLAGASSTALIKLTGGTTTLSGNIVRVGGAGTSSATVTLDGPTAVLNMGSKAIGTASSTVTFNALQGTLQNLGQLNGGGTLSKSGSGTLTLAGTNNYTGATTITGGTLSITGTLGSTSAASGITVAAGATLAGTGTVTLANTQNVTVTGTLVAGNPSTLTGTLTLKSATGATSTTTSFGAASTFTVNADSINGSRLTLTGVASIAAPLTDANALANTTNSNTDTLDLRVATPGNYILASWDPVTGSRSGVFDDYTINGYNEGGSFVPLSPINGDSGVAFVAPDYSIYYDDTSGQIIANVTNAVPEPAAFGAIGLAAVGLLSRRRRRSR